jgi:hypothetical protein
MVNGLASLRDRGACGEADNGCEHGDNPELANIPI